MRKILWLASWYPSRVEPSNGDFIQRHAKAASLKNEITVIHIIYDPFLVEKYNEKKVTESENLKEIIIYYRPFLTLPVLFALSSNMAYYRLLIREVYRYINSNGRPHCIHVHVPIKSGFAALWFKFFHGIKYFVSEHWGIYNDFVLDRIGTRSFWFRSLNKLIIKHSEKLISVSKYLGDQIQIMVFNKDYEVISNVVDTRFFKLQEKEKAEEGFRLIHVSNMVYLKNLPDILGAIESLIEEKNIDINISLVGPMGPDILEWFNNNYSDKPWVDWAGELAYEKVGEFMNSSDVLILYSSMETQSCVAIEALCCGLPVISSLVGGIPEIINHENGMLISPGKKEELIIAIKKMSKEFNSFNIKKIAEKAQNQFSYKSISEKFDKLYRDL